MLEDDFVRELRNLAREMGLEAASFESGHARWNVYSMAMRTPFRIDQLISLIGREPDKAMATSVALSCMEKVPEVLRKQVVSALPAGKSQDFASARVADLSVLDTPGSGTRADRPVPPGGVVHEVGPTVFPALSGIRDCICVDPLGRRCDTPNQIGFGKNVRN